ncbi:prolyl oligopeptidase family serine peptidase [Tsukamurella serpentis]
MDQYAWLEEVESATALDWARAMNEATTSRLAGPRFDELESRALAILDTDQRIPYPVRRGEYLWNFWRDAEHPYGLWRRTTLESFRSESPEWDVVIDVDALRTAEEENWVWHGAAVLRSVSPDGEPYDRALVSLSRGGADATVVREFSISRREFVADGFELPEAKTRISWIDGDTVYVGTDFGAGSLTDSGYPRIVKRWRRGTPIGHADTVFEGHPSDVAVGAGYDDTPGFERHFVNRAIDFHNREFYLLDPQTLALERIDVPSDADADVHESRLMVRPKTAWELPGGTVEPGSLVAFDFDSYRSGSREYDTVFTPDAHTALAGFAWTKSYLLLQTMRDVRSELHTLTPGSWEEVRTTGFPELAEIGVYYTDPREGDEILATASGFTLPPTLLHGFAGGAVAPLKSAPAFYDADGVTVEQFFATSDDGTQVPYFVVGRRGPDAAPGPRPTLLYGYGGFEVSLTPDYTPVSGASWIERDGVYVLANIRGGGEYGPSWHTSALKQNRLRSYQDFAAVARDLVTRGITTREQLGAQGGSNGGLLMGVMYTRYPELFGAIVCQVPLLDMRRYHQLLAGASWMAEYGDPDDPAQWAFISEYSPYQNLPDGPGEPGDLPALLVTTSTRDDRVHPAHARKFVAALREHGIEVDYYENIEGGHGGAADNKQAAFKSALAYEFLWRELSDGREQR